MITRRKFIIGTSTFALAPMLSCSNEKNNLNYNDAVIQTYRHSQQPITKLSEIMFELVRYGTMAANRHNSQPWKFKVSNNQIQVLPDFTRRCPAVDPNDHHLYSSLGCAAENILVSANAFGLHGDLLFNQSDESSLIINFEETKKQSTPIFDAIPERQCTRALFNGKSVSANTLNDIASYANSSDVDIHLLSTDENKKVITDYVTEGNSIQIDDQAFVDELRDWVRFNEEEALSLRDGLTYRSTGNPAVPRWIGENLFKIMFRKKPENDKYREQIASSAGIAVFSCSAQTKENWINVGRAYQRFALHSTALGIRHSFINQPVEVSSIRPQLANYLELGDKLPDLVIRFGYGDPTPRTLRRPISQVII